MSVFQRTTQAGRSGKSLGVEMKWLGFLPLVMMVAWSACSTTGSRVGSAEVPRAVEEPQINDPGNGSKVATTSEPVTPSAAQPDAPAPADRVPEDVPEFDAAKWLAAHGVSIWPPDGSCWEPTVDMDGNPTKVNVCDCEATLLVHPRTAAQAVSSSPAPPPIDLLVCTRDSRNTQSPRIVMDVEEDTIVYAVRGGKMSVALRFRSDAMSADQCSWHGEASCSARVTASESASGIVVSEPVQSEPPACDEIILALRKRPQLNAQLRLFTRLCGARGTYTWRANKLVRVH